MSDPAPALDILYEDNHCLAIAKPAGALSTHYEGKEETLDRAVKTYLKEKYHKPGNVFLGVVHRLDRPVSGVLLFARTSKAAARLAEQFREGTVEKVYWGVIEGDLGRSAGSLEDWLLKDKARGRGLRTDPESNLVTACAGDFAAACRSLAGASRPRLAVVTGFYIPHATPPAAETDGPLGAVFLAQALVPMGIGVVLSAD